MVHDRGEDAAVLLSRIAAVNGRALDEDAFGEVLVDMMAQEPDKRTQSLLLVRKHPWLLKNMALAIVLWYARVGLALCNCDKDTRRALHTDTCIIHVSYVGP